MRNEFERSLQRLQDEMLALGSMVEGAIVESVALLKRRDMEGSRRLIAWDEQVNQKRFAIERSALTLIATQQPMASDLRIIASILEIITDLERIGDYAKGIAKINLMIGEECLIKPLHDMPLMAQKASDLIQRALDAFVNRNIEAAHRLPAEDDEVDELYNKIYRDLLDLIVKDTQVTDQATYLLWAAHNLERTADRVVNICERIIFTATGQMSEMDDGMKIDEELILGSS